MPTGRPSSSVTGTRSVRRSVIADSASESGAASERASPAALSPRRRRSATVRTDRSRNPRPCGRDFRAIVEGLATIGQSFPPVAVLALTVPAVGFGAAPTVLALFVYGLLPILANAIAGLEGVPPAVREAAEGMGFAPFRLLLQVELPLAAPVILAGVRTSVTIAIGTATIGSTVGAVTLGTPIFDGLVVNKLPFVIEGAVLVALFAIVTDMLFARLEARLRRHLPA